MLSDDFWRASMASILLSLSILWMEELRVIITCAIEAMSFCIVASCGSDVGGGVVVVVATSGGVLVGVLFESSE